MVNHTTEVEMTKLFKQREEARNRVSSLPEFRTLAGLPIFLLLNITPPTLVFLKSANQCDALDQQMCSEPCLATFSPTSGCAFACTGIDCSAPRPLETGRGGAGPLEFMFYAIFPLTARLGLGKTIFVANTLFCLPIHSKSWPNDCRGLCPCHVFACGGTSGLSS